MASIRIGGHLPSGGYDIQTDGQHTNIEVFDNQRRRHSTFGQISPAEFERRTTYAASFMSSTDPDNRHCTQGARQCDKGSPLQHAPA